MSLDAGCTALASDISVPWWAPESTIYRPFSCSFLSPAPSPYRRDFQDGACMGNLPGRHIHEKYA